MGKPGDLPNHSSCSKFASELSTSFMSAVARMNESWDAIGMTEKEKLRSIKRVVKETMATLETNTMAEEDRKTGLVAGIKKLEEDKRTLLVSLQESDPTPPSSTSQSSLTSTHLQLKRDLDSLHFLKSTRLQDLSPLIKVYDELGGKIAHKRASNIGVEGEEVEVNLKIIPENYISRAGTSALKELISKREDELRELEDKEEMLKMENDKLLDDLGIGAGDLEITPPNVSALNDALKEIRKSRIAKLRTLGEKIGKLWNEMGVEGEVRREFQGKVKETGIREESQEVGEMELQRLRVMKASKQSGEITTIRSEITRHWEYCGYTEEQRKKFTHFYKDAKEDENIREIHQAYLEKVRRREQLEGRIS
ncbi:hypothetical protein TrCOL_g4581 [Triparma columacea]|uniref:Uncharacterized protein n=1 Tax=Triparma columacea TaxID=722753 RepID=A0A9W7L9M3_9STRA|nr:hypothetical protein TrCOL_g4581 [Triparma columacea]